MTLQSFRKVVKNPAPYSFIVFGGAFSEEEEKEKKRGPEDLQGTQCRHEKEKNTKKCFILYFGIFFGRRNVEK